MQDNVQHSPTSPKKKSPRTEFTKADKNTYVELPFSNTIMHVPLFAGVRQVGLHISVFSKTNIFWNIDENAYEHNRRNNLAFKMWFGLPRYAANREISIHCNKERWTVDGFIAGLSALEGGDPQEHDQSGRTTLNNPVPVVLVGGNVERKKEHYRHQDPPHKPLKPRYYEEAQHPTPSHMRPMTASDLRHHASPSFSTGTHYGQTPYQSYQQSVFNYSYAPATAPTMTSYQGHDYSAPYTVAAPYQYQDYGAESSYAPSDLRNIASHNMVLGDVYDAVTSDYHYINLGTTSSLGTTRLSPEQTVEWHHQNVRKATRRGKGWFGDCFVASLYADCHRIDENGHTQHKKILVAQVVSQPLCIKGRAPSLLRAAAERRKQVAAAEEQNRRQTRRY